MKETTMLTTHTLDALKSLRLPAMASGLIHQREHPDFATLSFEERLGLLVDAEILQRQNRRLERTLKAAQLRSGAVVEDLDFSSARGLDKTVVHSLVSSTWVDSHHYVMIVGPTGVGKTFVACALAQFATATVRSTCECHACLRTCESLEPTDAFLAHGESRQSGRVDLGRSVTATSQRRPSGRPLGSRGRSPRAITHCHVTTARQSLA